MKEEDMTIGWLSPLPPSDAETARWSAEVLPRLAAHHEVVAWTPGEITDATRATAAVEIRHLAWRDSLWRELHEVDVLVYHLGSSPELHAMIWDVARQSPGIAVLHDPHPGALAATVLGPYQQRWDELREAAEQEDERAGSRRIDALEAGEAEPRNVGRHLHLASAWAPRHLAILLHHADLEAALLPGDEGGPPIRKVDPSDPEAWVRALEALLDDASRLYRSFAARGIEARWKARGAPGDRREIARALEELFGDTG